MKKMPSNDNIFYKITNKDIYEELQAIRKDLETIKEQNNRLSLKHSWTRKIAVGIGTGLLALYAYIFKFYK